MNVLSSFARPARFVLLFVAALLLPISANAQQFSVSPTSISVQANAGTDAPSQTVRVKQRGNSTAWSVVPASASWLSVSPTTGVNDGTLTLTFRTSAMAAGQYQTSFRVQSATGSAVTVNVQASLVAATAPAPTPGADITVSPTTAPAGSAVTVSFSGIRNPTPTDWITLAPAGSSVETYLVWNYASSCTQTSGTARASGSCSFTAPSTAGNYEFRLLPNNQFTLLDNVTFTVTTSTAPPPPSTSAIGPQSTITCPSDAVDIWPGVTIQNVVDSYGGNTTFCLRAGIHSLRSSVTPRTGNVFVGEYGAILDGTGWSTSDDTQAAFRAHNQDIDYVTIRNLVIRNMPQRGIHAYAGPAAHWTIEYNEIASSANVGIVFPGDSVIRNNSIHHNVFSGYIAQQAHNTTLDGNEIAYNGAEQRIINSANVTFRNNFVHHNVGTGIYYDTDNTGGLIEGNRVEDNGWIGINYEVSFDGIIRNNTIRRNAEAGVFLSVSKNVQVYNNTLEYNFRGITYYLRCLSVGGPTNNDLTNITAHDNTITVGTQNGAFASVFSYGSDCTSTQVAPYLNGSKNLTFSRNTYRVPSPTTGRYWIWGLSGYKYWNEWQAIPQDATGTISQ